MKKTDTLKDIVAKKKERLILAKQTLPEEELKAKVNQLPPALPFIEAINKPRVISLIAEIKKASPSRGVIRENFNPVEIAGIYKDAGAQALSVLTEEDYFLGSLSHIAEAKNAADLPVLRKDFIFEPYQIYESRFFGADAVLLIADLLSKDRLAELIAVADSLGLDCLVETHTEKELKKVLSMKNIPLLGINNRDLHTLEVDLKTTERLFTLIPRGKTVVVESGVKTYQDILFLKVLGVNAVLVGEAFMASDDIRKKVEEVMGW
ncbi:MAG: indole-3-glycerol phosphate synthase TrpC [Candidatus Omnitrophota bacterium]